MGEGFENFNNWVDKTPEMQSAIASFMSQEDLFNRGYDPVNELHLSGGDMEHKDAMRSGALLPFSVNSLYEGGKIVQIHAIFNTKGEEGWGHLDVYIRGKALEDFLANKGEE